MAELHRPRSKVGSDGRDVCRGCGGTPRGWVTGAVRWYRFVRHEDRARFEAEGWRVAADLGMKHGRWSVLMQAPEGFDG